jgi:hypothetical protein
MNDKLSALCCLLCKLGDVILIWMKWKHVWDWRTSYYLVLSVVVCEHCPSQLLLCQWRYCLCTRRCMHWLAAYACLPTRFYFYDVFTSLWLPPVLHDPSFVPSLLIALRCSCTSMSTALPLHTVATKHRSHRILTRTSDGERRWRDDKRRLATTERRRSDDRTTADDKQATSVNEATTKWSRSGDKRRRWRESRWRRTWGLRGFCIDLLTPIKY